MRQLVSIKKITDLQPIPEADRIETATIDGGWKVVVKKQEFEIGDKCLYFEIDSILPTGDPRFAFLEKDAKNFDWGRGARLKTIKLKKQVSQGLALPIKPFQYEIDSGKNLDEVIGVRKWEDADTVPEEDDHLPKKNQGKFLKSIGYVLPKSLRGRYFGWINRTFYQKSKGSFPSFIRKSDQERCVRFNTVVTTNNGKKLISELNSEDKLVSSFDVFNGEECMAEITNIMSKTMEKRWLRIVTESGNAIDCTEDHRLFLPTLGIFRQAIHLEVGDFLGKTDQE